MKYKEILNYIHSLSAFPNNPGLERINEVCLKLGNPQNNFKTIHVAGTNGKGSVCAFLSSTLKQASYKVGTFVSPYITDFCERIQINGKHIDKNVLCTLSQKVIDTGVTLTEFEFITAVGFLYFSENNVDIAVLETGLGGRFDATNVIKDPLVSVITKIGLDHTAVLGDTIEQIAHEKCGIIKNESVVTSHNQSEQALNVIKKHAPNVVAPNNAELENVKTSVLGNSFIYKGISYKTNLGGEYQVENALIAIETLKKSGLNINEDNIKQGIENAFIPARLEVVCKDPLVVIDGAHNPDGAVALCKALEEYDDTTAIIGVMADKNYEKVLSLALPYVKNAICVTPNVPRALVADELAKISQNHCKNTFVAKDMREAMLLAKQKSKKKPIFIFGSLYLASEMRALLKD